MANAVLDFDLVARLPSPGDNVAIAVRRLDPGETIALPSSGPRVLSYTVLEGHRFAAQPIAAGQALLSWGLPFGHALTAIAPGEYVCNQSMLDALAVRRVPGAVYPATPNFVDHIEPFRFDERAIHPVAPVERVPLPRTFSGYRRPGERGVGTRNTIVILGTTSRTASFARQLTARLQALARVHPALDGIVAITHTEGGGAEEPNNTEEVLRALAGFIVHPNVGAVLAVDYGVEPITNARLRDFMRDHHYPLDEVPHAFLSLKTGLAAGLAEGERIVRAWLPMVAALRRTDEPLSGLRIALQCGGSDAFSGVSGNPLAGAVVHEAIRHGATGVLTETDESMGAESYLLKNVRDLATARAFVATLDAFREKLTWHGLTPESNPSAGNRFRGLYNIALKSLGAVHKKDPRTPLQTVIRYAQPLRELADPGFTFMNGPGNDLEGIAGQVGAGCNLIIFVTGNGSITNFPFVPTLKITTTTRRHNLLIHEMDINAGRYLDGEEMSTLAAEAFETVIATASGRKTKGEHAGHSQVSLWRNWRQTDASHLAELRQRRAPDGVPLIPGGTSAKRSTGVPPASSHVRSSTSESMCVGRGTGVPPVNPIKSDTSPESGTGVPPVKLNPTVLQIPPDLSLAQPSPTLTLLRTPDNRHATERVALILPTSMCSTQIARLAAERLNARQLGRAQGISRFVAFTHSEGCGFGGETMYELLQRTYHGYVVHPNVAAALLLEHGCEKIPNDVMRRQLESAGLPLDRYGWVSVQLDGGIEKALAKIEAWFASQFATHATSTPELMDVGGLTIGMLTSGPVSAATANVLARVAGTVVAAGGSILLPESDALLADAVFRSALLSTTPPHPTLAYGQPLQRPGLHVVASETDHSVENVTGFGGNGAHLVLTVVSEHARQGHPLLPVIQVAEPHRRGRLPADDIDLFLSGDVETDSATLIQWLIAVAQRERTPVANAQGFVDFQLTRGLLGLTT